MIPLLLVVVLCTVIQQLYIGQKDRELISAIKPIAAAPVEHVHIAQPIPDATDNIVVHFNIIDLNDAAKSNTSTQINHTASNSTNATEAVGHGASLNDTATPGRKYSDFFSEVVFECDKTEAFVRGLPLNDSAGWATWARKHCDSFAGVMGNATETFVRRKQRKASTEWTTKHVAGVVVACIVALCMFISFFCEFLPDDLFGLPASYVDFVGERLRDKDKEIAKLVSDNKKLEGKYEHLLEQSTGTSEEVEKNFQEMLARFMALAEKNVELDEEKKQLNEKNCALEKEKWFLEEQYNILERINAALEKQNGLLEDILRRAGIQSDSDGSNEEDDMQSPPNDPSGPSAGPNNNDDNKGGGEGNIDSNGADRGDDGSSPNDGASPNDSDGSDSPSSGPKEQSPGGNEPEKPPTSPTTSSDAGSTTETSRPHGSPSKSVPTDSRSERDEKLRRAGVPSGPKSMIPTGPKSMMPYGPKNMMPQRFGSALGKPNSRFKGRQPDPQPRGRPLKDGSFPNCPPGPLKPSDESQPPPSPPRKPDFTLPPGLGSMSRNKLAGPGQQ